MLGAPYLPAFSNFTRSQHYRIWCAYSRYIHSRLSLRPHTTLGAVMAAPTQGGATQTFINLLTRARQPTPDLPTTMLPVLAGSDIDKISLGAATMVAILCTLLPTVTEMRSKISVLHS